MNEQYKLLLSKYNIDDNFVPTIKNINSKILERVQDGRNLDMDTVHGDEADQIYMGYIDDEDYIETASCSTTHCIAGWAVHEAGKKGYTLEELLGWSTAATLIFAKSGSEIPNFYDEANDALLNLKRRAEREINVKEQFFRARIQARTN